MGSYRKEIVFDKQKAAKEGNSAVIPRSFGAYTVFEIELNKVAYFHLKVIKASNQLATRQNVYWVAQAYKKFKTREYLKFSNTDNKLALHEFLNKLNEGTIYGKKKLDDGSFNSKYIEYTLASTKHISKNYVATNPYLNNTEKRALENEVFFGNFAYKTDKKGQGIWLEGINYTPEFDSQGAFIIAVGEPEILSFCAIKRTKSEREVDAAGVIDDNCDTVDGNLIYGDILDLHLRLHNIVDYTGDIEVFCEGKSMNENDNCEKYTKSLNLAQYFQNNKENPSLNYNIEILDELLADLRWADKSGHNEGKDDEDSLKEYKLVLTLTPIQREGSTAPKNRPTLTREISFTVNYTSNFSLDEHEPEYVAQVVKVKQPPLVSQSYEQDCFYTELKVTSEGYKPKTFLKESKSGALITDDAGTTPKFSLVLGNKQNTKIVTIQTNADVTNCSESEDEEKHTGNVFYLQGVEEYSFENGDSTWDVLTNLSFMPKVQPYKETLEKTEQKLKFEAAYPYDAKNEHLFLWRYLFMHMLQYKNPAKFFVTVQSCRYVRTIWFNVHPDVLWAMHIAYDADTILYHDNVEVPLVKGSANYVSALASLAKQGYKNVESLIDNTFDKLKPFFYTFESLGSAYKSWGKAKEIINGFFDDTITYMYLGFHARHDIPKGETGTLINYSKIQPYKFVLNYYIFQIIMLTLAVDILLIYLTRGKVMPSLQKAQKIAKRFKKLKGTFDKTLDKYNLTVQTPKISMNAALHKEMQPKGHYATIFEYTLQARPLLQLATEYTFDTNALGDNKFKNIIKNLETKAKSKMFGQFVLILKAEGNIWYDINIRFNTHTNKFTLNNNAQYQENDYNKVLRDGDIIKTEGNIKLELVLKASGSIKKEFKALWFEPVDVEVSFKGEIELHSSVGITKKFGYTKGRGPYLEKILYFGGLKGEFYQKAVVKFDGKKRYDSNKYDKKTPFTVFKPENKSFGRDYLFELFEPKEQYQYENK